MNDEPTTEEQIQSGAVEDPRSPEEQERDFKAEEAIATFNPVNWEEKRPEDWRKFPIFNQNGSGSCVAQTEAKELGIMRWLGDGSYVHFSATDIYQQRKNKPQSGMWATDARDIVRKGGATLEILAPSQAMTDRDMDSAGIEPYKKEVGAVFAVPNYLALPIRDIDAVASVIQTTGKGVMVWFYFARDEWTAEPTLKHENLPVAGGITVRHSITAVDYTLKNGVKHLVIEDSWGPGAGMGGQRLISEDFYKARNIYAGYLLNFRFEDETQPGPQKPVHTFNETLRYTPTFTTNDDVVALQNILKYEGIFPKNISSSGYYGSITARAVLKWQKKYKIASDEELDTLQGKVVGPKTRARLNAMYSQP